MALANNTVYRAKHVTGSSFGGTAWTTAQWASVTVALDTAFDTNQTGVDVIIDLVGSPDTVNPTQKNAFAKDFKISGNERKAQEEALLGADTTGSQNTELGYGNNSKVDVTFTCVYRNPKVTAMFNDSTKCCLIEMDNSESSTTGVLNLAFNNITVVHVGSMNRNSDGLLEQQVKFSCRGGFAGAAYTIAQTVPTTENWYRVPVGLDMAEEIRTS